MENEIAKTERKAKEILEKYKKLQDKKLRMEGRKETVLKKMKEMGFSSAQDIKKAIDNTQREIDQNISDINEYIDQIDKSIDKFEIEE